MTQVYNLVIFSIRVGIGAQQTAVNVKQTLFFWTQNTWGPPVNLQPDIKKNNGILFVYCQDNLQQNRVKNSSVDSYSIDRILYA